MTQGKAVKKFDRDQRERFLSQLIFADATRLFAESAEQLQCLGTEFKRVCEGRKLKVNLEKTRFWWWEGKMLHLRSQPSPATPLRYAYGLFYSGLFHWFFSILYRLHI